MSLPIIVNTDLQECWDCHQCGHCCRGSLIPLSQEDLQRLKSQRWEDEPEYQRQRIMVRHRGSRQGNQSGYRLAQRADGSCIFLSEAGLCQIHAKFGIASKPMVCQTFPLQLIPHDKQAVLTIRRACPSAAADLGTPAADRLPWIKRAVHEGQLYAEAIPAPAIKPGEVRDWRVARGLLDCAGQLMRDERYPIVRRLVHVLQYASLLSQAKTRRLDDAKVLELARTLLDLVPEESKPFFADRAPPKNYSKIMFRLLAVDCARLHPACRFQSRWSARLQLMRIAAKIALGTGKTPVIDSEVFPAVPFASLEEPTGALTPELYKPLNRFIESTSASFLYAQADRPGWSVVESIQGLAMLYPIGLWLLRWVAHQRSPTVEDVLPIVVALDRTQSYAPLSGFFHRQRLGILASQHELERLVVWYAQ